MIPELLRALPKFKGKQRIARLLLEGFIKQTHDFMVKGKLDCQYLIPNCKETIGFELLINGIYEQETIEFILLHLREGGLFLDLGANIGTISIPVCKRTKHIRVICVGASPRILTYLTKNVEINDLSEVSIIQKAISNTERMQSEFLIPKHKSGKGLMSPVFTYKGVFV